jgi:hypothetical protein
VGGRGVKGLRKTNEEGSGVRKESEGESKEGEDATHGGAKRREERRRDPGGGRLSERDADGGFSVDLRKGEGWLASRILVGEGRRLKEMLTLLTF